MPLTSTFFRDDRRLQDCLVQDAAHVALGAAGSPVLKIQQAVILLDQAVIDAGEPRHRRYGQSTAAAVLAYKTKRDIINRAYQTRPDNIVGKMTIARLDAEMSVFERQNPELTDPRERARIQGVLDRERPGVEQMIQRTLTALAECTAVFASPQTSAALAQKNRFALEDLKRFFGIDASNASELPQVIANYQAYRTKLPRLKGDQRPADYATLLRDHPDELEKGQVTAATPPAFSQARRAMFFTPRYRLFNARSAPLFRGFFVQVVRGIQLHEMGHFYFGFDDGDPRGKPTKACLRLASSYDLLARQITFQTLVAQN